MSFLAEIEPLAIQSGAEFTVRISGATQWAGQLIQVFVAGADDVEMMALAWLSVQLDAQGNGETTLPGLEVARETVVWVTEAGPDANTQTIEVVAFSIVGSPAPVARDAIVARYQEITSRRESRYRQPIGSPSEGLARFRAAFLVEGLFITQRIESHHGTIHPLPLTIHYEDQRAAINATLEMLTWPSRVNDEAWDTHLNRKDLAVIEFPEIWANDWGDADQDAVVEAERLMSAIAFMRHAAPRMVMVVLEKDTAPITCKMRSMTPGYKGNLATGMIAGESQSQFIRVSQALTDDPKAALYVNLFLDAQRETEPNSRYFKLWSVLETIAINNVPVGQQVTLADGSLWPDGRTTKDAAPRVFELVRMAGLAEAEWPGGDLYTFVRSVYGRRNATAHYGRLVPGDTDQQAKNWYAWAARTLNEPPGHPGWLWSLEHLVHDVVSVELRRVP